jgi:hypothetical protein
MLNGTWAEDYIFISVFFPECFDNCVGVLVICVLVFTVFCIVCTVLLYFFRLCIFILICY